jgi:hypothetical protein
MDCTGSMFRVLLAGTVAVFLTSCGPKDQEECRVEAAKDAKSAAALEVLLDACLSEFPANRTIGGGYEYMGHPVAGPVPTKAELEEISQQPDGNAAYEAAGIDPPTPAEEAVTAGDAASPM